MANWTQADLFRKGLNENGRRVGPIPVEKGATDNGLLCLFCVDPIGKPRMTQRDKWKKRPAVTKYYAYKDMIVTTARGSSFVIPECGIWIKFYIPMPKSWSKKKKALMNGKPHQQKPDIDNLVKALFDSLCEEDSHIWDVRASKFWCPTDSGKIEVYKV